MKKGKQKSTTGIGASLSLDYRDEEESNNISQVTFGLFLAKTEFQIANFFYHLR